MASELDEAQARLEERRAELRKAGAIGDGGIDQAQRRLIAKRAKLAELRKRGTLVSGPKMTDAEARAVVEGLMAKVGRS